MYFKTYCDAFGSIPLNLTFPLPEGTGVNFSVFFLTVTLKVAFFLPASFAVAVIVTVPSFFVVTLPLDDTVATLVLLDFHVTAFVAASFGLYVG